MGSDEAFTCSAQPPAGHSRDARLTDLSLAQISAAVTVAAVTVAVVVTAVMAEEGVMALGWITTTEADVAATGVAAITTLCGMPETFGAATATNADAR